MIKWLLLLVCLPAFFSCNDKLYMDEVDRSQLCRYFSAETRHSTVNGKTVTSVSPQLNKFLGDKVTDFIQKHSQRFDYLMIKTFVSIPVKGRIVDSNRLKADFCKTVSGDSFYHKFGLLTSGDRNPGNKAKVQYTVPELMKVASRFFMCDRIDEKDTTIGYHICVGINGIAEIETSRDYTVLEAFAFEAIFRNLHPGQKFVDNFHRYISIASRQSKQHFTGFREHLAAVKNSCFAAMEKDKDLQVALLAYYRQHSGDISFQIE